MPTDALISFGVGAVFVVVGVLAIIWGFREEGSYYESVSHRVDVREYLERWPPHPQPWALKLGGIISILVALGVIALGVYFWVTK